MCKSLFELKNVMI